MTMTASPPDNDLVWDRGQDLTHIITLPAGTYLPASGWALEFSVIHPTTLAALFTAKTVGSGVTITTAGSPSVDAVFTIAIVDTDTDSASTTVAYRWLFRHTDNGSEVNIDGGKLRFRR